MKGLALAERRAACLGAVATSRRRSCIFDDRGTTTNGRASSTERADCAGATVLQLHCSQLFLAVYVATGISGLHAFSGWPGTWQSCWTRAASRSCWTSTHSKPASQSATCNSFTGNDVQTAKAHNLATRAFSQLKGSAKHNCTDAFSRTLAEWICTAGSCWSSQRCWRSYPWVNASAPTGITILADAF